MSARSLRQALSLTRKWRRNGCEHGIAISPEGSELQEAWIASDEQLRAARQRVVW